VSLLGVPWIMHYRSQRSRIIGIWHINGSATYERPVTYVSRQELKIRVSLVRIRVGPPSQSTSCEGNGLTEEIGGAIIPQKPDGKRDGLARFLRRHNCGAVGNRLQEKPWRRLIRSRLSASTGDASGTLAAIPRHKPGLSADPTETKAPPATMDRRGRWIGCGYPSA